MFPSGIDAAIDAGGNSLRTLPLATCATTHLKIPHYLLGLNTNVEPDGRGDAVVQVGECAATRPPHIVTALIARFATTLGC